MRYIDTQIYHTNGLRGFTRGIGATLLRETPSYGVRLLSLSLLPQAYFATFELSTRYMDVQEDKCDSVRDTLIILCAGGFAGIMGLISRCSSF